MKENVGDVREGRGWRGDGSRWHCGWEDLLGSVVVAVFGICCCGGWMLVFVLLLRLSACFSCSLLLACWSAWTVLEVGVAVVGWSGGVASMAGVGAGVGMGMSESVRYTETNWILARAVLNASSPWALWFELSDFHFRRDSCAVSSIFANALLRSSSFLS